MIDIRPLLHSDLTAMMNLSKGANWNQIETDWNRLVDLWPDTCLGGWKNHQCIATGTLASYKPDTGWIGMILVDTNYRGQGIGTQMFEAILEKADQLQMKTLGLDATDMGVSIYSRYGFETTRKINRWRLEVSCFGQKNKNLSSGKPQTPKKRDWKELYRMDHEAVGVERTLLLQRLVHEPGVSCRFAPSSPAGYGLSRRGKIASMIGPIVAKKIDHVSVILDHLISDCLNDAPTKPIIIDVLEGSVMECLLDERGFQIVRRLTRMVRPLRNAIPFSSNMVFATAGFEFG